MKLQLDLTKEYGLVLEGGGAKGSYQIGAWKALREAGVAIKGIAGASVGALNGAMICMDEPDKAEYIWENISYSRVMDIDDDMMETMRRKDLKGINMRVLADEARRVLKDKGFDITPLKELIESVLNEEKIRTGPRELYMTTFSVSDRRLLTINARDIPPGEMGNMLMASAYLPVFKNEKLGGKRYLDGAGWNNVPTSVLLDQGYKDVIVIRIYGLGFDSEKVTRIPEDAMVYHIAPRQNLGGILQFDKKMARKNMRLGYYDALRFLYGLEGRWYYLDAPESEAYYFERLVGELEFVKTLLSDQEAVRMAEGRRENWTEPRIEGSTADGNRAEGSMADGNRPDGSMADKNRAEGNRNGETGSAGYRAGYRYYMEQVFPALAKQWKMKEEWNYKELYLAILEHGARKRRISRFRVYTPGELRKEIMRKQVP